MINRKLLTTLAFLTINIGVSKAQDTSIFSNLYSFGDSFTAGNSWAGMLNQRYGFRYDNSNSFANGGQTTQDLANQLARYGVVNNSFNSNAIYAVFMGPSDLPDSFDDYQIEIINNYNREAISQLTDGTLDFNTAFPRTNIDINVRAQNMSNFIKTLADNNAKYILFLNYFDDSLRQNPLAVIGVSNQQLSFFQNLWKNQYNKAMYVKIVEIAPNANVIYIDNDRLVTEVTTNPSSYFTQDEIDGTYNNNGYFLDAHPTLVGHRMAAQYITSIIESPSRIASLREIAIEIGHKHSQRARDIAVNLVDNKNASVFQVEATGDFTRLHTNQEKLGSTKGNTMTGGLIVNYHATDNMSIGGQLELIKTKTDFNNGNGKATVDEYVGSLHSMYNFSNPLFIYSNLGLGKLKYDINRHIKLGIAQRTQQGKTQGIHYMVTAGMGYVYALRENMKLIPHLVSSYQSASLKAYLEQGQLQSTTMFFDIPKRQSLITEIGITVKKDFILQSGSSVNCSTMVSYNYDFKNSSNKVIKGKVSDMPRTFNAPSYEISKSSLYIRGLIEGNIYNDIIIGLNGGLKPIGKTKLLHAGFSVSKAF
ncbi:MAG: autotransporter domain-containing protein [Rickettsiaceae bacterium]|nr:MAG: autotransporter domain-containing protein [Rickettsiaceae bacterium]